MICVVCHEPIAASYDFCATHAPLRDPAWVEAALCQYITQARLLERELAAMGRRLRDLERREAVARC